MRKKILTLIFSVLFILPSIFILSACGKDEGPTYSITYDYDYTNVSSIFDNFKESEKIKVSDGVIRNLPKTKKTFAGDLKGWYIKGTNTKVTNGTTIDCDIELEVRWNYLPSGHYDTSGYTPWSTFVDMYSDAFNEDVIICNYDNGNSSYFKNISGKLVISNSITGIGNRAFYGSKLNRIILPSSVTDIGYGAFSGCDLKKIELPSSLIVISESMLSGTDITYIYIPSSVRIIYKSAFSHCLELEEVEFGVYSELWKIEEYAFYDCQKLKNIMLPNSVSRIYREAFSGYNMITEINIPESITTNSYDYNSLGNIFNVYYTNLETILVDSLYFDGLLSTIKKIYINSSLSMEVPMGLEITEKYTKQATSDKAGYDMYLRNAE